MLFQDQKKVERFCENAHAYSPFAEFLKRRSDHTSAFNDTVAPNSDISKISSDDTVIHHDGLKKNCQFHKVNMVGEKNRTKQREETHFSIEDDVLTAAKHRLSADFVA